MAIVGLLHRNARIAEKAPLDPPHAIRWPTFADALIAALGARAGCSATVTFDRKALWLPGFELLSVL